MNEINTEGIPSGDSKEEKKQRKQFIKDFYRMWKTINPSKRVFILRTVKFCARWDEVVPRPNIWRQVKLARIFRTRYNFVRAQNLTVNSIIIRSVGIDPFRVCRKVSIQQAA